MDFGTQKYQQRQQAQWAWGGKAVPSDQPNGLSGFWILLMIWLRFCRGQMVKMTGQKSAFRFGGRLDNRPNAGHSTSRPVNRTYRRMHAHMKRTTLPTARNLGGCYRLAGRGKTPAQFAEWLAHHSGFGRISVYRMRRWRKTVKGKSAPLGTGHEYWCDPLETIRKHGSRLSSGLWVGHLWPG